MAIDNCPIEELRENMSLANQLSDGWFTPKPLLDFGNKLGMYNVDVLLGLEVYFWHISKMLQHLSNIRMIVQQFNCEFFLPAIKKITHLQWQAERAGKLTWARWPKIYNFQANCSKCSHLMASNFREGARVRWDPQYIIYIWFCECPVTTAVDLYYLQTKNQRSLLKIRLPNIWSFRQW